MIRAFLLLAFCLVLPCCGRPAVASDSAALIHPLIDPAKLATTSASLLMSPIHDRMPAILRPEEMAEYLAGSGRWDFQPFAGPLVVTPCASPLAKSKSAGSQQELF